MFGPIVTMLVETPIFTLFIVVGLARGSSSATLW